MMTTVVRVSSSILEVCCFCCYSTKGGASVPQMRTSWIQTTTTRLRRRTPPCYRRKMSQRAWNWTKPPLPSQSRPPKSRRSRENEADPLRTLLNLPLPASPSERRIKHPQVSGHVHSYTHSICKHKPRSGLQP